MFLHLTVHYTRNIPIKRYGFLSSENKSGTYWRLNNLWVDLGGVHVIWCWCNPFLNGKRAVQIILTFKCCNKIAWFSFSNDSMESRIFFLVIHLFSLLTACPAINTCFCDCFSHKYLLRCREKATSTIDMFLFSNYFIRVFSFLTLLHSTISVNLHVSEFVYFSIATCLQLLQKLFFVCGILKYSGSYKLVKHNT